ncbi:MAG: hypothetical protein QXM16_03415 [Nitrososphaerota archaeon]
MGVLRWLLRLLRTGRPTRRIAATPEDLVYAEKILGELYCDRVSQLEARLKRVRKELDRLRERIKSGV